MKKNLLLLLIFFCFSYSSAFGAINLRSVLDGSYNYDDLKTLEIGQDLKLIETEKDISNDLINQACVLYNENKYELAFHMLNNVEDKNKTPLAYFIMANILADYERPLDAIFSLQKAIQLDEKYYKAYYNLGNLYAENNQTNNAIVCYKNAIKYKSGFSYAYFNLGNAYFKSGNFNGAKKAYVNAIRHDGKIPEYYYNLSFTYKKLNDLKKAQKYLDIYNEMIKSM